MRLDLDAMVIHEETLREHILKKQTVPVQMEVSEDIQELSEASGSSQSDSVFAKKKPTSKR